MGVVMRRLLLAAAMAVTAAGAQAADMPDFLRGSLPAISAPVRNWDGWYVGGQVSESWTNTDYGRTVVSTTNNLFRNTTLQDPTSQLTLLGRVNGQSSGFGAFVGRNWQFDDIVLGVEANYNYWTNLGTTDAATLGPIQFPEPGLILPAGSTAADSVTLRGSAALQSPGRDNIPWPRGLGNRRFPALYVRRPRGRPDGRDAHGIKFCDQDDL